MIDEKPKSIQPPTNSLKKNVAANFVGTFWQAFINLAFIPIYINYLGIESYGLIGIFSTLQVVFGLLDVGLGSTLTREIARLSVLPNKEQETRNLVRTLETVYWGIAVFAGLIIVLLSPFIAHHWIKPGELSPQVIEQAILLMGFITIFQMPAGFYSGGLMGLQKQVLLNVVNICVSTLRSGGAILVLWLISPTIQTFLLWQIVGGILNTFLFALFLWRNLPRSEHKAEIQLQLFKNIWRFTAGMSGISVLAVILTQVDKVILSKLLSLEMFGYYSLASLVAMSLGRIFTPIFFSIYPKFTQLVSVNNLDELKILYHKSCQFIAAITLPIAIVIAFFSYELIFLWTQNAITAEKTHLIISIMICGTALNGLMNAPYALQLAFGWTKLPFYVNLVSVILFIPLIISLVSFFGAVGGAVAWFVLNLGYIIFWIPIMHKRLLPKEKWQWYWNDVGVPILVSLLLAGLGRLFFSRSESHFINVLNLGFIALGTLGITLLSVPKIRTILLLQFAKIKLRF